MTPTDCDGCAAISQPTEVSDSWKRAGERKRAALCPYLAVLSEGLPSLTDRVDAALEGQSVCARLAFTGVDAQNERQPPTFPTAAFPTK